MQDAARPSTAETSAHGDRAAAKRATRQTSEAGDPAHVSGRFARVFLTPNNGGIGGGEIMLLRTADALRALGVDVTVVAPAPSAVHDGALRQGLPVIGLPARSRLAWMRALRRWDRRRPAGLLWCNGLVPSLATAGRAQRLVHLHQMPTGIHRTLTRLARRNAVATLVPSRAVQVALPGAHVLPNWTDQLRRTETRHDEGGRIRIGFLGRLGLDKGVHVLAEALGLLDDRLPGRFRLVLAGEPLFVPEQDLAAMERALAPVAHLTHRAGWVDAAEFFDTIDLLVVPSVIAESFGLVAAEAMAAGVPLIVSDAGALPEVVGERAQIVPAGDARALAARIAALAAREIPSYREELFERWRVEFSPEAGSTHLTTLVDALGVRRGPS